MDEPGAEVEGCDAECVPVIQAQKRLDEPYPSHLEVAVDKDKLKRQEMETKLLHQQLKGADEEQKKAVLKAQEQKETLTIFKQKYTAAIEKVHKVQGQVEFLEEELRYSQKKLKESQLETHSVQEELAELERRYGEKVSHWESSQEALDQLTDELQAYQSELGKSQREKDHFKSMMGSLQEQMDTLKQQKLMAEFNFCLYQQCHIHSDEEYLSLSRLRQQLQKCCTGQAERLSECEKAILKMKSELERQTLAKDDLEKSLAASHQTHLSSRRKLEQEVTRLKQEASSLELKLSGTQKLHVMLLRKAEEQLKEAKQESAMRSKEVDVQRGEVQRLVGLLQKEEEKMKTAAGEMKSLRTFDWQLRQELDELHSKHQEAVEELAARAEEARRMEGCPNERKLAEEKIRSAAVRLEKELSEIRENLQQAVDQKLTAERDKQDAQERVKTLQLELEGARLDNAKLRHESQLVITNINLWITKLNASRESLTQQMEAQNMMMLVISEEKEHLQEANDTLKAEVKRLKEAVDEKERDMERFKAQIGDWGIRQDGKNIEKETRVARSLNTIEDMHSRLQSNMEAIGMLNQQLNIICRENKRLRRQLEEERSTRRRVKHHIPRPSTSQHCFFIHPPSPHLNSVCPPTSSSSSSSPSFLGLLHPLSTEPVAGDTWDLNSK